MNRGTPDLREGLPPFGWRDAQPAKIAAMLGATHL